MESDYYDIQDESDWMLDALYGDSGQVKGKPPYEPDLHLKMAIKADQRAYFMEALVSEDAVTTYDIRKAVASFQKIVPYKQKELRTNSEAIYGFLFNPPGSLASVYTTLRNEESCAEALKNFSLAKSIGKSCATFLGDIVRNPAAFSSVESRIDDMTLSGQVMDRYSYKNAWTTIRDTMKDSQSDRDHSFFKLKLKHLPFEVYANGEYLVLGQNDILWLFDYHQVLMITDTVTSRYQSILYLDVCAYLEFEFMPTSNQLIELYQWGDQILDKMGNVGYNLIKMLESIITASHLRKHDVLPISKEYLSKLLNGNDLSNDELEFMNPLLALLESIDNPNVMFELYGAYRHFGHPTVDELAAIDSLKQHTRCDIPIDEAILKKVSGAFNRTFILEFIHKNKRWPKCSLPDSAPVPTEFKALITNKPMIINEYDLDNAPEYWYYINFETELLFDDFPDFTELLLDKSISPYLENWFTVLNKDITRQPHSKERKESKRLLIEMLKRDGFDCKDIREAIEAGNIPLAWKCIALHSKEQELKIKSRLFALLCLEMRFYFSMAQKNVANSLLPYMPYQTMSWSNAELTKVLLDSTYQRHKTSRQPSASKFAQVIISLDFNKFNLRWRKESTDPIFGTVDQLFGTKNFFTYAHRFFEQAFYYLSSPLKPPEYLKRQSRFDSSKPEHTVFESETTHIGQGGGCEGQIQKLWTLIISSALVVNMMETGLTSIIVGQGDNQVLVVFVPVLDSLCTPDEYLSKYPLEVDKVIRNYLANLENIMTGIGMELKLEETYVSNTILNYGKEIIYNGSYLSGSMKKISKTFSDVNDIYPTLRNRLAAISTSAQSGTMRGFDAIAPYILSVFEILNTLSKETRYGTTNKVRLKEVLLSHNIEWDVDIKLLMLLTPPDAGGFPIVPFPALLYRGHPDTYMTHYIWIKHLGKTFPIVKSLLGYLSSDMSMESNIQFSHLIQDAHSVNQVKSRNTSNVIKDLLLQSLRCNSKNKDVKIMFQNISDRQIEAQEKYLETIEPCYPRVLNEIWRLSPQGCMMSFLAIFNDTRTMKMILNPDESHRVMDAMKQEDLMIIEHFCWLTNVLKTKRFIRTYPFSGSPDKWEDELSIFSCCSYKAVENIRNRSWNRVVQGVTVPHPSEQTCVLIDDVTSCPYPRCSSTPYILYIKQPVRGKGKREFFKRGPHRHYLGSKTTEKRSGTVLKYPKTERALYAAQQLKRVEDWMVDLHDPCNTLKQYINALIESRTNASENFLKMTAGENYASSGWHRFPNVTSSHENRPGMLVNINSHIMMSSDKLGVFSLGKENHNILFQGCYLLALGVIQELAVHNPERNWDIQIPVHQHFPCPRCVELLHEPPLNTHDSHPKVVPIKESKILYSVVDEDLIHIPDELVIRMHEAIPRPDDPLLHIKSATCCALSVLGELHTLIAPVLHSSFKMDHRHGTLSSLTVGYFERIDLKILMKQLAIVWFLDNLPAICHYSKTLSLSLWESCSLLIERLPDHSWDLLKPFLCLPSVSRFLVTRLGFSSTSAELFISGKGLGSAVNKWIVTYIRGLKVEEGKNRARFRLPITTPTPGVSLYRAVFIWVNGLLLSTPWEKLDHLYRLVDVCKELLLSCIDGPNINLVKVVVELTQVMSLLGMPDFPKKYNLVLSRTGPEPWLKPSILDAKNVSLVTRPIPDYKCSHIMLIMRDIGLDTSISYSLCLEPKIRLGRAPLESAIPHRENDRSDHYYRQVGTYSTAGLKFLNLLACMNILSVRASMHLGEGAGGMGRACHLVLGAKTIIYNSLFNYETAVDHRGLRSTPAELLDIDPECIKGTESCFQTGGDFTDQRVVREFQELAAEHQPELCTCDAEFPGDLTVKIGVDMITSFLRIAVMSDRPHILYKTFLKFPHVVKKQIAVLYQFSDNVSILISRFSSHLSSEVYLYARLNTSRLLDRDQTALPVSISDSIDMISQHRIKENPLLTSYSKDKLITLYRLMHNAGIQSNFFNAVDIFLGHIIDTHLIRDDIRSAIRLCRKICDESVKGRFLAIGKTMYQKNVSSVDRHRILARKKDSTDVSYYMSSMANCDILEALLNREDISPLMVKTWDITHEGVQLFSYQIDPETFKKKYNRSLHKIIGFLGVFHKAYGFKI